MMIRMCWRISATTSNPLSDGTSRTARDDVSGVESVNVGCGAASVDDVGQAEGV